MARILGIDPGLRGGAAVIDTQPRTHIIGAISLPTYSPSGTDAQNRIDVPALCAWLARMKPDQAVVELVGAMPSIPGKQRADGSIPERRDMGTASTFKFGRAVGMIEAAVIGSGIKIAWLAPTVWKRHHGLVGPDKEQSRQLAIVLFGTDEPWRRKKDTNRAEAALIAFCHAEKIGAILRLRG